MQTQQFPGKEVYFNGPGKRLMEDLVPQFDFYCINIRANPPKFMKGEMLPDYQFRRLLNDENLMKIHNDNQDAIFAHCQQYRERLSKMYKKLAEIAKDKSRILDI